MFELNYAQLEEFADEAVSIDADESVKDARPLWVSGCSGFGA